MGALPFASVAVAVILPPVVVSGEACTVSVGAALTLTACPAAAHAVAAGAFAASPP